MLIQSIYLSNDCARAQYYLRISVLTLMLHWLTMYVARSIFCNRFLS